MVWKKQTYTNKNIEDEWGNGNAQTIDFIVTEDCNLRCKYCYICHKKANHVMEFEIAKNLLIIFFREGFNKARVLFWGLLVESLFLKLT